MIGRVQTGAWHARPGSLWGHRDFLRLWGGETISLIGSQVTTLALPLTAISLLHASAFQVGLLNAAGFAPFLLVTLFAGLWIDRQPRRPILIAANVARAILLGIIPLLALTKHLGMVQLDLIWFLAGIGTVFFHLAYQAFVPSLLRPEQFTEGNSKLTASESLAEIGGPGLAGVLLQILAAPLAITFDAASFVVAALSLRGIRKAEPPLPPTPRGHPLRDIAGGFRLTLSDARLRAFAGEATTYNLCWQVMTAVFVLYLVRVLHLAPVVIGLIFAAGSMGGLVGALVTDGLARRWGVGRVIVAAACISCIAPLAFPLAHDGQPGAVALLMVAFFVCGGGVTACNVHAISLRQALIPMHLRGRMHATYRVITYGAIPIGALLGGVLGQNLGLHTTLLLGAIGLACAWLWLTPLRRMRQLPLAPLREHS
jgi:MFS family permease